MMPVLRVTDPAFDDLAILTKWFKTKTPSETIAKIARDTMEELGIERDDEPETITTSATGAMEFREAPGLSFTKPLEAVIDGKPLKNPRWSSILLAVIGKIKSKGRVKADALIHVLNIPAKVEPYEEDGFKFYEDLGISVQGQSASDAWKETARLAKVYGVAVTVEFWWRQNPKAQFPGRTGKLKAG